MEENNYGWICPKCGCPNSPANKTCAACFSPTISTDLCSKCGMDLSTPLGFCCPDFCCPQRSSIKPFNPNNAAQNFGGIFPPISTNIREEDDLS